MSSAPEIKTQLWTVASRLQRAQSKFEHLAQASRKDIASVITRELQLRSSNGSQDEVEAEKLLSSARLKAEKLIVDDEACDLMGILERYCDVLLEGQLTESAALLDLDCLEAVSGILVASPRVDAPELHTLSQSLAQRYPGLISESELRENISLKLVAHLNPGRPSRTNVDINIVSIAQSHGLSNWTPPELLPPDRERQLLTLLESTTTRTALIDERALRRLCAYSIPTTAPASTSAWLRYRAWSVLLGVLPTDKRMWSNAQTRGRTDYAALSKQILEALATSPPPLDAPVSLSTKDKALLQFSKDVEALPVSIRDSLYACIVPHFPTTTPPPPPPQQQRNELPDLHYTEAVDSRIFMIKNRNRQGALSTQTTPLIPTITLEDPPKSPFSPTSLYSDPHHVSSTSPTVLLGASETTKSCESILLRLLYIHSMLHSSHATSFGPPIALAAIFAVVLIVVLQAQSGRPELDTDPVDTPVDIEAEVFWMVQAIVGNTREVLEGGDEGDEVWTRKFSNVVRWADNELWMDLNRKGLDPALPYYSYRWVPTLFTHTLQLGTLLPIWDAIFSVSNPREGSSHQAAVVPPAQTHFVYTIGATMLIRARAAIFQTSAAAAAAAGNRQNGGHTPGTSSPSGGLTSFWKRQGKTSVEISLPHSPSPYSPIASPKTPQSPTMAAVARGAFDSDGQGKGGASGGLTPGSLSNVFLVAVKLLQEYDVDSFGGTERLLGAAWSLWKNWCRDGCPSFDQMSFADATGYSNALGATASPPAPMGSTSSVTAGLNRLRDLAWKGIANEMDDDASPVEGESPQPLRIKLVTPKLTVTSPASEVGVGAGFFSSISSGLGSKLGESVWKGVTNQLDSPDLSPDATPEASPTRSSMLVVHDGVDGSEKTTALSSSWAGEGAMSWAKGYADKLKGSDTAANLSMTGTNLRAKATTVWARNPGQNDRPLPSDQAKDLDAFHHVNPSPHPDVVRSHSGTMSPATSSVGSWGEMFSKRGSLPFVAALVGDARGRDGPDSSQVGSPAPRKEYPEMHKRDSYSPPAKPSHFRAARDSVIGTIFSPTQVVYSPELSQLPNSPPSAATEGSIRNPLQAALAALSGSPKVEAAPKRGPKPLLLSSGSLITRSGSRSGLNSRTPSRRTSPSPTPTPRPGGRFSLSTEGEDSAFNRSGVVSLRRGPLTNPRTAGYGVSNTSREGTRSSRDSTSSGISTPASNAQAFPFDMESEEDRRGRAEAKKQRRGFEVDPGVPPRVEESGPETIGVSLVDPLVLRTDLQVSSSDEDRLNHYTIENGGTGPLNMSTRIRSKRQPNKPAPIVTDSPSLSTNNLPELMITTPRSGDNVQPVSQKPGRMEDLTIAGTPVSAAKGATLSRSRSSTRRMKKPRQGSAEKRLAHDETRDSMLSVGRSGSEEEGARADVEDLDDIYDMY